jgi:lipid kinase YegS
VPLGTANDFAHACHIPLDPSTALRLSNSAEPRRIDVGHVAGRPFINMATGGFGTEITVETRPELKKALHGAAYLITGLTHLAELRPVKASFTGPGFSWGGELLVLAVGNGRQAGGGHILCPDALVDDGLLDLSILPDVPHGERAAALHGLLHGGKVALWRHAVTARLPWVELAADEVVQVNLDGEPVSGKNLRFEILPGALEACLPEEAPVLRRVRSA